MSVQHYRDGSHTVNSTNATGAPLLLCIRRRQNPGKLLSEGGVCVRIRVRIKSQSVSQENENQSMSLRAECDASGDACVCHIRPQSVMVVVVVVVVTVLVGENEREREKERERRKTCINCTTGSQSGTKFVSGCGWSGGGGGNQ